MTIPAVVIRQGDKQWSDAVVGVGAKQFGAVGCLVCCIQQAACALVDGASTYDPRIANLRGKDAGAFDKSKAIIEKLAAANGMKCGPRREGDVTRLRTWLLTALSEGHKVLLHVDHDSTLPKGDPEADHWVLAVDVDEGGTVCTDPATGKLVRLSEITLKGVSGWRDGRPYQVLGLRVLSRA